MSFVLDNSVVMRWLLGADKPEHHIYAQSVLKVMPFQRAFVPSLWALEAASVMLKAERKNKISSSDITIFIDALGQYDIVVDEHTATYALNRTLQLARQYQLSSYDASYLELA